MQTYKELLDKEFNVTCIEVWRLNRALFDETLTQLKESDLVITHPLTEVYTPLDTKMLKKVIGDRLIVIQNLYYRGLHPDCTYVGKPGKRHKSPMSDYHSQVVYTSWEDRKSIQEACQEIREYPEEKAQAIAKKSLEELKNRDLAVDIPATPLLENMNSFKTFHTFNHPTLLLCRTYLEDVMNFTGMSSRLDQSSKDPLAKYPVWPIYPSAAKLHNIEPCKDFCFNPGKITNRAQMSIEEFVEGSYNAYDKTLILRE